MAYGERMSRSAPVLAAVLAFGLTGCHHGSNKKSAPPPPSPYTPQAVRHAFARAGVALARDPGMEEFIRTSGHSSDYSAFFADASDDVEVAVRRTVPSTSIEVIALGNDGSATKTQDNVEVTYPKRGPQARRVLRALRLLRKARPHR